MKKDHAVTEKYFRIFSSQKSKYKTVLQYVYNYQICVHLDKNFKNTPQNKIVYEGCQIMDIFLALVFFNVEILCFPC